MFPRLFPSLLSLLLLFFFCNFLLDSPALSSLSVTTKHTCDWCCRVCWFKNDADLPPSYQLGGGNVTMSRNRVTFFKFFLRNLLIALSCAALPPRTLSYFLFHCLHLCSSLSFFSFLHSHPLALAAPSYCSHTVLTRFSPTIFHTALLFLFFLLPC